MILSLVMILNVWPSDKFPVFDSISADSLWSLQLHSLSLNRIWTEQPLSIHQELRVRTSCTEWYVHATTIRFKSLAKLDAATNPYERSIIGLLRNNIFKIVFIISRWFKTQHRLPIGKSFGLYVWCMHDICNIREDSIWFDGFGIPIE